MCFCSLVGALRQNASIVPVTARDSIDIRADANLSTRSREFARPQASSSREDRKSAIDAQNLPVNELAALAGEKGDGVGDLARLRIAMKRLPRRIHPVRIDRSR